MLYDNFLNVRNKLSNSSCLIESSFGFKVTQSLLPVPLKTNGSIVYYNKKILGLASTGGIIIKNINKENIPCKYFLIKKKFNNNELQINTRNNENNFKQVYIFKKNLIILITNQIVYIYNQFEYIYHLNIQNCIGCVGYGDYLYVITQNFIQWIYLENLEDITFGIVDIISHEEMILGFEKIFLEDKLLLYLLTKDHIYVCNTPVFVTHTTESYSLTQTHYDTVDTITKIHIPNTFEDNKLNCISSITIDDDMVKNITHNKFLSKTYLTYFSLEKYIIGIMYNQDKCEICYYLETDKKYSIIQINNDILIKNQYSNKLFLGKLLYQDLVINIHTDIDLPVISKTLYDSLYVDITNLDHDNELYYPRSNLPSWFDYKESNLKSVNNNLLLDGGSYGIIFLNYNHCDIQLLGYIKPFPYYNSSVELIQNSIVIYDNDFLILNQYTGLLKGIINNQYSNLVNEITSFSSDDSLFIIPKSIKVKVFSYNSSVHEKVYLSDTIWYDNVFNIILFNLPIDIIDYVKPFPIKNNESMGLNNIALTYSILNNYSPIISSVNALGMYNGSSNYTIENGKLKYVKLLELGNFIQTNIDSYGSLLFSKNFMPLGLIVNYYNKSLLIENKTIHKLLDKHIELSLDDTVDFSYTKDNKTNNVIDVIYYDNRIKDILFYSINSRKFSVMKRNLINIQTEIEHQIFEIYTISNEFTGYFYLKQKINVQDNTNIPYYLKQFDYLFLSPFFKNLNDLVNDTIDPNFINLFSPSINIKYRLSNMYLKNNDIKIKSIGIHKLNTSNLGINVININDMNQNLFDIAFKDQNIHNNITFHDITTAIYINIE